MKFFVDSATAEDIRELAATVLIDGVTTNPSLVARTGKPIVELIAEICAAVEGPVSSEVAAISSGEMIREGRILGAVAPNVAVKLPMTWDGLKACKVLTGEHNLMVNLTLCFSANQALLAAKAGATFVSPFVGRLVDTGLDGMDLIDEICTIYRAQEAFETEVLVAYIRSVGHVIEAAKMGAHVATMPPAVLRQLYKHPLTDAGLAAFLADWEKTGQSILDS